MGASSAIQKAGIEKPVSMAEARVSLKSILKSLAV
jgi:hypothetical protein